jgi:hypothetical protein
MYSGLSCLIVIVKLRSLIVRLSISNCKTFGFSRYIIFIRYVDSGYLSI